MKEIPFENDMYGSCWRSNIEYCGVTICAAGWTGGPEEIRTRTDWKRCILMKIENKMGLASRRPWQEGGSQKSEQDRQRVTFIISAGQLRGGDAV